MILTSTDIGTGTRVHNYQLHRFMVQEWAKELSKLGQLNPKGKVVVQPWVAYNKINHAKRLTCRIPLLVRQKVKSSNNSLEV